MKLRNLIKNESDMRNTYSTLPAPANHAEEMDRRLTVNSWSLSGFLGGAIFGLFASLPIIDMLKCSEMYGASMRVGIFGAGVGALTYFGGRIGEYLGIRSAIKNADDIKKRIQPNK